MHRGTRRRVQGNRRSGRNRSRFLDVEIRFDEGIVFPRIQPIDHHIQRTGGQPKERPIRRDHRGIDVGCADQADGDAGAGDSRCVQRIQIVLQSKISGRQLEQIVIFRKSPLRNKLAGGAVIDSFAEHLHIGRGLKIVDRTYAGNHWRQRGRHLRIEVVGVVLLALDRIAVNLGVKSGTNLSGGPGKFNRGSPSRDPLHRKPLPLQPSADRSDLRIGRAIVPCELLRRQPVMIVGTSRPVRLLQKPLQRRLAFWGPLQQQ